MLFLSTGCPASIGPEVSVAAAARAKGVDCVLVGDLGTLKRAAALVGVAREQLVPWGAERRGIYVHAAGPKLSAADRRPGKPTPLSGRAQLEYVNTAYALVQKHRQRGSCLVTAPVNKAAINGCGAAGAREFFGHTEWLQRLDGAQSSVMCFASPKLSTSLVTTHLALKQVPGALTAAGIADASYWLGQLLLALKGPRRSLRIAVCSLNPHAGEGELLGSEERLAIIPGIQQAVRRLPAKVRLIGPLGAETAYRKAYRGEFDGVVAMYHDQATVPMKLVAFGSAVNVTMGLSVPRTSVDHGTGYDIAWQGIASYAGMAAAIRLGAALAKP